MFDKKERDYVTAAIRHQSFSEAADELFTTKATIRNAVMKEEAECGTKLFTKKNNRLVATLAAKSYQEAVREIEEIEGRYKRRINNTDEVDEGEIRFGGSRSFVHNLLVPLMFKFHAQYPHVNFLIESGGEEKLIKAVIEDRLDFIMAQSTTLAKYSLAHKKLMSLKPVLVINKDHPIAQKYDGTKIDWEVIKGEPFVSVRESHPLRDAYSELKHKTGAEPKSWLQTDNAFSATWLAYNTNSWTLTSKAIVNSMPALQAGLKMYYINNEMADRYLELAYDDKREQPKCVQEFIKLIKTAVKPLPSGMGI